ncbi:MAG: YqgE/AlgH family protein [Pirellulaceae bacterium]
MKSLSGKLLIASPHLSDPNFHQTVVLLAQHDEEGAMGLILNRPGPVRLWQLWDQITGHPCQHDDWVGDGGPVSTALIALHRNFQFADLMIADNLFLASSKEHVEALVEGTSAEFRLYRGYSGWGAGQLEDELQVGGWLLGRLDTEQVFAADTSNLWKTAVQSVGRTFWKATLGIHEFPDDVSTN